MTLQHINIEDLTVSPLNVRKYGAKDCADLVTSIRALGVLQPLLVRPADGGFEVIAGQRRLNACRILAEETTLETVPCLVMKEGDDAAAIEASLAENIERQPMDEVDQYRAFDKLIKEGRDIAEIAATFAITERMVEQRLALGRLHAPILTAYRKGDIHARDIRNLTMATLKQQKAWCALAKDEDAYAPTGQRLKDWLFGGAHIPTANALFDVDASGLAVVSDLFGEDSYFADAETFWTHQDAAIADAMETYQQKGWAQVVALEMGTYFARWDHRTCSKKEGGHVFVEASNQGEVTFHEGYITAKEAKRRDKAATGTAATVKPELTKAMQNYLDLHRHAAVRCELLSHQGIALRLTVAQIIAGSRLWSVQSDPQKANTEVIKDSLATNRAEDTFADARQKVMALLGMHGDVSETVVPHKDDWHISHDVSDILEKLMAVSDDDAMQILIFVVAETLPCGSALVESLGAMMQVNMQDHWASNETYLGLMRDKGALNAMIAEVAGKEAADAHITATAKSQRAVIQACLDGTRKAQVKSWMPRHMAFPQGSYATTPSQTDGISEADQSVVDKHAA